MRFSIIWIFLLMQRWFHFYQVISPVIFTFFKLAVPFDTKSIYKPSLFVDPANTTASFVHKTYPQENKSYPSYDLLLCVGYHWLLQKPENLFCEYYVFSHLVWAQAALYPPERWHWQAVHSIITSFRIQTSITTPFDLPAQLPCRTYLMPDLPYPNVRFPCPAPVHG